MSGRYLNLDHLKPLYEIYNKEFNISKLGVSELGEEISLVEIGSGPFKVFAWSQMHGNESTTTKALFDFLNFYPKRMILRVKLEALKRNSLFTSYRF